MALATLLEGGIAETYSVWRAMKQLDELQSIYQSKNRFVCFMNEIKILSLFIAKQQPNDLEKQELLVLEEIVRDETRHSSLAWQTLQWTCNARSDSENIALQSLLRNRLNQSIKEFHDSTSFVSVLSQLAENYIVTSSSSSSSTNRLQEEYIDVESILSTKQE